METPQMTRQISKTLMMLMVLAGSMALMSGTSSAQGRSIQPYEKVGGQQTFYVEPGGTGPMVANNRANPSNANDMRQQLCTTIPAGSTVVFLNGVYDTNNLFSNEVYIQKRNCSRNNPILIKAQTKGKAIIDSTRTVCTFRANSGRGPGITGGFEFNNSSGFVVQGFWVKGSGAPCAGYEQGLDAFNSSHITFRGNKVTDVGGRGIGSNDSSSIRIEDNLIIGAAGSHPSCTSAIDHFHFELQGDDNDEFGYANYIINNKVINTRQAPNCGSNGFTETDGNCMVIDRTTETSYPLSTLIANNVCIDSDGGGIHIFESGNIDVFHNTTYRSNRAHDFSGEFHVNCHTSGLASNVRFIGNVAVGYPGKYALWGRGNCADPSSIIFKNNVVVGDSLVAGQDGVRIQTTTNTNAPLGCSNTNIIGMSLAEAGFTDPGQTFGDSFRLKRGSKLINKGCNRALPMAAMKYDNRFGKGDKYRFRRFGQRIDIGAQEYFGRP